MAKAANSLGASVRRALVLLVLLFLGCASEPSSTPAGEPGRYCPRPLAHTCPTIDYALRECGQVPPCVGAQACDTSSVETGSHVLCVWGVESVRCEARAVSGAALCTAELTW